MAQSLETPWAGSTGSLDCAPTTESTGGPGTQKQYWLDMDPAKLITLAWDVMQVDLAAEAMTDPGAQDDAVSTTLPSAPWCFITEGSASSDLNEWRGSASTASRS